MEDLDGSPNISGIEDADTVLRVSISVILMSRPADIPLKLAAFEAVIGYVREARVALDKAVGDLDHEPTGDALGYATEMMTGLDTTLITLEHLSRTLQAASNQTAAKPRPMPLLSFCPNCKLALLPEGRHQHECGGGRNAYHPDDLDDLIGLDGFRVRNIDGAVEQDDNKSPPDPRDPPVQTKETAAGPAPVEQDDNKSLPEQPNAEVQANETAAGPAPVEQDDNKSLSEQPNEEVQANEGVAGPDPKLPRYEECPRCGGIFNTKATDRDHYCDEDGNNFSRDQLNTMIRRLRTLHPRTPLVDSRGGESATIATVNPRLEHVSTAPAPRGMRDGCKKHKIYVATRKLLEDHGEMHIDEMLKRISQTPEFSRVKNHRAHFANKLSDFRKKGLVLSDNRGNYSLPNGKAAR